VTRSRFRDFDDIDDDPRISETARRVRLLAIGAVVLVLLIVAGYLFGRSLRTLPPSAVPAPTPAAKASAQLAAAARSYLAIANPSDKQLDVEEDAYADDERDNLAAAKAELRAQVATERQFDAELAAIKFPASVEATAQALIRANEARFRVTLRQARAKTLARLRALDSARKAGDAAVEVQAELIRKELHLPPVPAS
jgi:hypothetical protein